MTTNVCVFIAYRRPDQKKSVVGGGAVFLLSAVGMEQRGNDEL